MKRRTSSRSSRPARPSSRRQRSGDAQRSLGPLLRLALPVLATALTLGSLLVNTMSGGSTTAWVMTGVSVLVCASAWWTHFAASSIEKAERRAAEQPPPPEDGPGYDDYDERGGYEDDRGYEDRDGYGDGPGYRDRGEEDGPGDGRGYVDGGAATAVHDAGAATAAFPSAPGPEGGDAPAWAARDNAPDATAVWNPAPTGEAAAPRHDTGDTGGFPTIPPPPYGTTPAPGYHQEGPGGHDDPLAPPPAPGGAAPGYRLPPDPALGGPPGGGHPAPGDGPADRYGTGASYYPGYRGDLFSSDAEHDTTGRARREDRPWPEPPSDHR